MAEAEKVKLESMDIAEEKREQLKSLFPEAFTEGNIDFEQLKRALGEWVEPAKERFGLSWPGKAECMKIIQQPSVATLKPARDESVNFDDTENLFIEGDNLEVLKLLQKSYFGKVKMIYIDPPYNTGNDFIYPDDYSESLDTYLEYTGQKDNEGRKFSTNTDSIGRYHSRWLNMMYPRLYLARNLLCEDGVAFISIDDNEVVHLRELCDLIFGEENFISQITVLNNPKGRALDKYLATCHEYALVYSKNPRENGSLSISKSNDEIKKDYPLEDKLGQYRLLELRNTHREFGKHNRPNLSYPFYVDNDGKVFLEEKSGTEEVLPIWDDGFGGCWTWGREKAEKEISFIVAKNIKGSWKIYRKGYASLDDELPTKKLKTIWSDKKYHTEKGQEAFNSLFDTKNKIFQSPKSIDLLVDMMRMSCSKEDIVLDFFAGSGTLGQATLKYNLEEKANCKYILVQLPEICDENSEACKIGYKTIADVSKERIRRAAKKIEEEQNGQLDFNSGVKPDLGFKVFKLSRSNFKIWEGDVEKIANLEQQLFDHIDHIDGASKPEAILYELLLKSGFPLTTKVETIQLAGKDVFSVEEGALLICLDKNLTQELIDAIAEESPLQVICLDEGFKGNDQLKANAVQTFKARAQEEESEIVFRTV